MYFSSAFVFSLVIVVNLYGAVTCGGSASSQYRMPPNHEVVNIGNGFHRTNVIVVDDNPSSNGAFGQPDPLGNRFGSNNQETQRPRQPTYPGTVNNIGHGFNNQNTLSVNGGSRTPQTQSSARNNGVHAGTSFVRPGGNDVFHVGYGTGNNNQIHVNNRPTVPVNSGSRNPQTQNTGDNARNNARNNGGYQPQPQANINQVYVNGQPLQPDRNDGVWSTYQTNGQTIHVLNTGNVQPSFVQPSTQLKTLYSMSAQIQQIKSQIKQAAERLNIQL